MDVRPENMPEGRLDMLLSLRHLQQKGRLQSSEQKISWIAWNLTCPNFARTMFQVKGGTCISALWDFVHNTIEEGNTWETECSFVISFSLYLQWVQGRQPLKQGRWQARQLVLVGVSVVKRRIGIGLGIRETNAWIKRFTFSSKENWLRKDFFILQLTSKSAALGCERGPRVNSAGCSRRCFWRGVKLARKMQKCLELNGEV